MREGAHLVREWFDGIEDVLSKEAALAGLLEHGTSIGDAREFFVRRVLRTFLPPGIHVSRGIVFSRSQRSRQIDIILFDSRYPVFEIEPGFGLYPVEGVIGTIEVKSRLTTSSLHEALDNCLSVMRITPAVNVEQLNQAAEVYMRERECASEDAEAGIK